MELRQNYHDEVEGAFFSWVQEFDERDVLNEIGTLELLQDYIAVWLLRDSYCVEVTGGDYANFLLAVVIIVAAHSKNPCVVENYRSGDGAIRKRPLKGLIDFGSPLAHYLAQQSYQQEVFRHLTGRANA